MKYSKKVTIYLVNGSVLKFSCEDCSRTADGVFELLDKDNLIIRAFNMDHVLSFSIKRGNNK